jgi:hypothetical protein
MSFETACPSIEGIAAGNTFRMKVLPAISMTKRDTHGTVLKIAAT